MQYKFKDLVKPNITIAWLNDFLGNGLGLTKTEEKNVRENYKNAIQQNKEWEKIIAKK